MRTQALFHADEGIEAVRSIRNEDFALLTTGAHGLTVTNGKWEFSGQSDTDGNFVRELRISQIETGVLEVVSHVTWGAGSQLGTVEIFATLTDWQNSTP